MTLHPGEEFTRKVFGEEEHLTLASLECRMSKYQAKRKPSACLLLKTNMREHVICTLEKGATNQQCLDLVFEQGEKITFLAEGTGIIYLTGYTTKQQEQQNEMQEEPSVDIFITDREDEGRDVGNNDKMSDNQGKSNQANSYQEGVEALIKQENESEDGMQDSEKVGEELDAGPSTIRDAGSADGGDVRNHDLGCRVKGDDGGVSSDGIKGSAGAEGDSIQCHVMVHIDDISGDIAGYNKGARGGGDDRDLHSDGIHGNGVQGDGNSCDHVDNSEVHLSVACVPSDEKGKDGDESLWKKREKPPHQCKFCGKIFNKPSQKRNHESIHINGKQYKCRYCEKHFTTIYIAKRHETVHTNKKRFKCQLCPKTYMAKSYLEEHMRSHTGERPFQCHMCPSFFSTRSARNRHIRGHKTKYLHQCQKCGKGFSSEKRLEVHDKMHTEEPKYSCRYCDVRFVRLYHRLRHENMVHLS